MFDFSNEEVKKSFLNECGLYQEAKLVGLEYRAEESYECFDILLEVNGSQFSNRVFSPDIDKVFPKKKYENNQIVGEETKEEAYQRTYKEIFFKVRHLALCYASEDEVMNKIGKFSSFKDLVDKTIDLIGDEKETVKLNFLTVWKNNDRTQKNHLVIPERIKWVEPTVYTAEGKILSATIQLTPWQQSNQTTRKDYTGSNESLGSTDAILNDVGSQDSDLPF